MKPLLALVFPIACATTSATLNSDDLPRLPKGATGIAIRVGLQTEHGVAGASGCTFVFYRGTDDHHEYDIDVPPGESLYFAPLPAGSYRFYEANCEGMHWELATRRWPRFRVEEGKISLVSGILAYVNKSEGMAVHLSTREQSRDEAQRFLGLIPAESKDRVISGYTGKPVNVADLDSRDSAKTKWLLMDGSGNPKKAKRSDWPSFKTCEKGELEINALFLGRLEIDADYESSELKGTQVGSSWNTFSDHFAECVKDSLKGFHPPGRERLRYAFYF